MRTWIKITNVEHTGLPHHFLGMIVEAQPHYYCPNLYEFWAGGRRIIHKDNVIVIGDLEPDVVKEWMVPGKSVTFHYKPQ